MKGMGAILGLGTVVVVGAAAYFIAKGKHPPTNTARKPVPKAGAKAQAGNFAMNQLTSANIAAVGSFGKSLFGGSGAGAAKVAPTENGGFVTEADFQPRETAGTGDYASDFVTEI